MSRASLASVLLAPRELELDELPLKPLQEREARLRVHFAGICGTDISLYSGDYPVPLPLTLGHEFSGIVEEVNNAQDEHLLGRAAVSEINNSCIAYRKRNVCAACRRGLPTHCLVRTVTGIINHPGAFAQHVTVPTGNVHVLPPGLSLDQAVLIEPLAAALRTFELSPVGDADTVVVLGCGRLGRLVALVAFSLGAQVIAVGRSKKHLDLVAPFAHLRISFQPEQGTPGVHSVASASELRSCILDYTSGLGADVVVEATASNENLPLAQQLVRPLGTVALKSTCGRPVPELDTTYSAVHEVRFQGSRCGPFDKAIQFMQQHGLPSADWITARFPLEEVRQAIGAARTEEKVVLAIA